MEQVQLGRTGVSVSRFCLGAMMFGGWGSRDHDESIRIIHAALRSSPRRRRPAMRRDAVSAVRSQWSPQCDPVTAAPRTHDNEPHRSFGQRLAPGAPHERRLVKVAPRRTEPALRLVHGDDDDVIGVRHQLHHSPVIGLGQRPVFERARVTCHLNDEPLVVLVRSTNSHGHTYVDARTPTPPKPLDQRQTKLNHGLLAAREVWPPRRVRPARSISVASVE
jgi:hypothetical protein